MKRTNCKQINGFYTEEQVEFLAKEKEKTANSDVVTLRLALEFYKKHKEREYRKLNAAQKGMRRCLKDMVERHEGEIIQDMIKSQQVEK